MLSTYLKVSNHLLKSSAPTLIMATPTRKADERKMHISHKLAEAEKAKKPVFSFEFFPPKTQQVNQHQGVFSSREGSDNSTRACKISTTVCQVYDALRRWRCQKCCYTILIGRRYGPNA